MKSITRELQQSKAHQARSSEQRKKRKRKILIGVLVVGLATVGMIAIWPTPSSAGPELIVYKDPNCGCCGHWIDHVKTAGFRVAVRNRSDLSKIKQQFGIGPGLMSCHTAVVEGYAVEGHVPADLIQRLLAERPAVTGIAVPGMPAGSPGMEGLVREQYDVVTFDRAGVTRIYATRGGV